MPVTFEFFQYIQGLLCYSPFSNSTSDNGALLAAKGANIRAIPGCTEKIIMHQYCIYYKMIYCVISI